MSTAPTAQPASSHYRTTPYHPAPPAGSGAAAAAARAKAARAAATAAAASAASAAAVATAAAKAAAVAAASASAAAVAAASASAEAAAARMSDFPPQYGESPPPPPSGYRIPLSKDSPYPESYQSLTPVAYDLDGSPTFLGSALTENAVYPCKIVRSQLPHALFAIDGKEIRHGGRYDMLPFVEEQMEWVPAAYGQIPEGRRPVEGGYEEGGKLYHSISVVKGVRVPGKTGEHIGGACAGFDKQEHRVQEGYEILCWKLGTVLKV